MRSVSYLPQLLTVFVVSAAAAAQSPWGFPLDRNFVATALNGQVLNDKAPTLVIQRDSENRVLRGSGFAGCNEWQGEIALGQNRFDVNYLGATKKYCVNQMTVEANFLTALRAVKHWHMDGTDLVLEGEQTNLRLMPVDPTQP
jgi:heat shock protein HslJ